MWVLFLILLLLKLSISVVYQIQALVGEGLTHRNVSRKMSLVIGARRHLEWGHEKYILETINSHPALVSISVLLFYWLLSSQVCFLMEVEYAVQVQLFKICTDDFGVLSWSYHLVGVIYSEVRQFSLLVPCSHGESLQALFVHLSTSKPWSLHYDEFL
jgi:hypothetical protein